MQGMSRPQDTASQLMSLPASNTDQPTNGSGKAYQPVGEQYDLVMHDTADTAPPLHARIPVSRHRPRCCSCMSDFPAQRYAVFSSSRAMPQRESNLLLPLQSVGRPAKLKGTASLNCHRVKFVAVSYSVLLRCVQLKLSRPNAWF